MKYTNILVFASDVFEEIVNKTNYKVTKILLENLESTIKSQKVG